MAPIDATPRRDGLVGRGIVVAAFATLAFGLVALGGAGTLVGNVVAFGVFGVSVLGALGGARRGLRLAVWLGWLFAIPMFCLALLMAWGIEDPHHPRPREEQLAHESAVAGSLYASYALGCLFLGSAVALVVSWRVERSRGIKNASRSASSR
jgi:hypothetical protein